MATKTKHIVKPCPFCGGKAHHYTGTVEVSNIIYKQSQSIPDSAIKEEHKITPFGNNIIFKYAKWHSFGCNNCQIKIRKQFYWTEEDALKAWNTRSGC